MRASFEAQVPAADPYCRVRTASQSPFDSSQEGLDVGIDAAGTSRLTVWPVLGAIQSPALGSVAFSIRLVSRQAASSSPTTRMTYNKTRRSTRDKRSQYLHRCDSSDRCGRMGTVSAEAKQIGETYLRSVWTWVASSLALNATSASNKIRLFVICQRETHARTCQYYEIRFY